MALNRQGRRLRQDDGRRDPGNPRISPITIDGEKHYVCLMNPYQVYDVRTNTSAGWLDIQKAAATADGKRPHLQGRPWHVQQRGPARARGPHPLHRLRRGDTSKLPRPFPRRPGGGLRIRLPGTGFGSTGTRGDGTTATRRSSPRPRSSGSRRCTSTARTSGSWRSTRPPSSPNGGWRSIFLM